MTKIKRKKTTPKFEITSNVANFTFFFNNINHNLNGKMITWYLYHEGNVVCFDLIKANIFQAWLNQNCNFLNQNIIEDCTISQYITIKIVTRGHGIANTPPPILVKINPRIDSPFNTLYNLEFDVEGQVLV